mmetsp:Transcript_69824/g.158414  ORF Transcript_69824/g.158414 Transcript_69824/m.158414 type:complete len:207 (+) Transcript_69824:760-1380(+)
MSLRHEISVCTVSPIEVIPSHVLLTDAAPGLVRGPLGRSPLWLATAKPIILCPWRHLDTRQSTSISPPPVGILRATETFGVGAPRSWASARRAATMSLSWCSSLMQSSSSLLSSWPVQWAKYGANKGIASGESMRQKQSSTATVTSWDASTSCTVPLIWAMTSMMREMTIAEKVTTFARMSRMERNSTCSDQSSMTPAQRRSISSG